MARHVPVAGPRRCFCENYRNKSDSLHAHKREDETLRGKVRRGVLLSLVFIGIFAIFVFYSLTNVEPLKVVDSHLQRQSGRVFVEGTVRNTGPDARAIGLEVRYYNQQGVKLAEERVELEGLHHGADVRFRTPAREIAGATDFSLSFDRGRNPYGN